MSDLRANATRMRELIAHLIEREDAIPFFYCDHVGLVTIAIGFLVDQRGAPDATGQRLARQLAARRGVTFTDSNNVAVDALEVERDWDRVKAYGRTHVGAGWAHYRNVARLRISEGSISAITEPVVMSFLDQLYLKRPFVMHYDPRIAMALVDVRYNPAGVVLYGAQTQPMWDALNPSGPKFDVERAINLFEQIWAQRGVARYGVRHYLRVKWMREGLLACVEAPQSV